MKYILLVITIIIFTSCENKNHLELKLLNEEVICLSKVNLDSVDDDLNYRKSVYAQSQNLIRFSIENNSDEKYLLMFNSSEIEPDNNDEKFLFSNSKNGRINFSLYHKDSLAKNRIITLFNHFNSKGPESIYYNSVRIADSLDFSKKKDLGYKNNRDYNFFIVYPKEVKYFITLINLPIRDYNYNSSLTSATIIDESKEYQAGMVLINNIQHTKKNLTEEQRREIDKNGYTIFDGKLISNKIPVKLIPMKD